MWADRGLKWRVLRLHLSDLHTILYRHTLGDEDRSCESPMSVIIMGAEICWRTGFVNMKNMIVDGLRLLDVAKWTSQTPKVCAHAQG